MKTSQLLLAVVAIAAVALVAVLSGGGGDDGGVGDGVSSAPVAPKGSVRVSFAYSPEKEKLLSPLIRRFNSERAKVNGKRAELQH